MNAFAHALPYLDRGRDFAIGCAVPDWLGAVDRRCRVRRKGAIRFVSDGDPLVSHLAGGIMQHIDDDHYFHSGRKFTELTMVFALELRELLTNEPGFRPGFLGHILIELLLDGFLYEAFPDKLDQFYDFVQDSDPVAVQSAVNRMATRPTDKLQTFFPIFLRERYLYDYVDDKRLMYRVNHVLRRVKLKPSGDQILEWIPNARERVYAAAPELLSGYALEIVRQ